MGVLLHRYEVPDPQTAYLLVIGFLTTVVSVNVGPLGSCISRDGQVQITPQHYLTDHSPSVSGPDGQWNICTNYDGAPPCAMHNAPYGSLVGKIGTSGTPFLIGSNYTFTAGSSGSLYLAVNDLLPYYADNYRNYMVFFNH